MKRIKYDILGLFIVILGLFSCNENELQISDNQEAIAFKVAVIMPAAEQQRWNRVVLWALEHIDAAQKGLYQKVKLEIEWQDEEALDWLSYMEEVVTDDSYVAVIGPKSSVHARKAAQLCKEKQKTLILPVATSTEFQRIYAGSNCVWNLSQSDITQCELLLSQAKLSERHEVSLLTSDDDYGKSFSDWFAFQAMELGLKVNDVVIYQSETEIRKMVRNQCNQKNKYNKALLFAPGNERDAWVLDDELGRLKADEKGSFEFPLLLCSDMMNSPTLLSQLKYEQYEGLFPSAAPESGFNSIYQAKFKEEPICGEAHLFDAVIMLAYALAYQVVHPSASLNDSMLEVVDGRTSWNGSWLRDDMNQVFNMIRMGIGVDLNGVTGDWTFDARTHASVLNTTYTHWILKDSVYATLEFLSTDGGARTTSTIQAWEWQNTNLASFNRNQKDYVYPELNDRWAIVVGASNDWVNYRHQADALAMYQLLKRHGYDDEHIILVMEDNLAYHKNNVSPGVVKVRPDGENLYLHVKVDYKLSEISFADLKNILLGNRTGRLSEVIESRAQDNVIMFWCGHGSRYSLAWGSNGDVSGKEMRDVIETMYNEHKYRKLFFALDACYSGTIGEACTGLPGVVVVTAANSNEPSKADMKDSEMGVWLSNGFTRAFQEVIDKQVDITLRDLYYILARQTIGSHAMMYNVENYGNVFNNSINEYLR